MTMTIAKLPCATGSSSMDPDLRRDDYIDPDIRRDDYIDPDLRRDDYAGLRCDDYTTLHRQSRMHKVVLRRTDHHECQDSLYPHHPHPRSWQSRSCRTEYPC